MFVVMRQGASEAEILGVKSRILAEGLTPYEHAAGGATTLAVVGEVATRRAELMATLAELPGVERVTPIQRPFKLTSREFHPEDTVIRVLDAVIGDGGLTVMAGPCSVESREQLMETAESVAAAGATVLRGGAFKPRTSPYAFQGLGEKGLKLLAKARRETGLAVVTELLSEAQADLVAEYADILQIGARNAQNFQLLIAAARTGKPVLLKRGLSMRIEEWLLAGEYVLAHDNANLLFCERGIRTFETYTRNTLDLSTIPIIKKESHCPIVIDPSQGAGRADLVSAMCKGAVAMGADALLIEVHPNPAEAWSDGAQQVTLEGFAKLMEELKPFIAAAGRE